MAIIVPWVIGKYIIESEFLIVCPDEDQGFQ